MRYLAPILFAAVAPVVLISCAGDEEEATDLGNIADGKSDAPAIRDVAVTVPKLSTTGKPGVKNYTVRSTVDFTVTLAYDADNETKIMVTDLDSGDVVESSQGKQPVVSAHGDGQLHTFKIRLENYTATTLHAKLSATGKAGVSAELLAAARANLDRIAKEVDYTHLNNYGLTGSTTDQFMTALAAEYETQHPDQYIARVKALASMAFFALPDVKPPADGVTTPFHGLDMDQFSALASIEDQVFDELVSINNHDTNGVRPFSVCETKFIVETYVRPKVAYPGFTAYKSALETYAASCPAADKAEWYNFRGLGGLRPSWVESNLSDRFLRRMAKNCKTQAAGDCAQWNNDRFGYRQLRNRQLAASTMFYADENESYLTDPNNSVVLVEDRNGDNIGEFLKPGPVTLTDGQHGTLQVNSTGEFTGNLKFVPDGSSTAKTVTPAQIVATPPVDTRWDKSLLTNADMGLQSMFSDATDCTAATLDQTKCPMLRRFYSMIDRHENFYRTYSALSPDYYGISSQPSPLVACSITLGAAHAWDTAGTPSGGTAGFIFLMRIPFKDILTGNETSVATIMPGPRTTSIQSLYNGGTLNMNSAWLDVASLSNNQYATEHEISAFGAVPAGQIEGILVIRKPAAVQ